MALWNEHWSEEHSTAYYFETERGESSWERPPIEAVPPPPPQPTVVEGWSDCSEQAAALMDGGGKGVQRAWRRMSRERHPDKGGTADAFQSLGEVREFLRSPLRYFAWRTLVSAVEAVDSGETGGDGDGVGGPRPALLPLGHAAPARASFSRDAEVRRAAVWVREDADGWPVLTLDAELLASAGANLSRRHRWSVALAARDGGTIEYRGDDADGGGYDVCCGLMRGSACTLRNRDEVIARLNASADATEAGATAGDGDGVGRVGVGVGATGEQAEAVVANAAEAEGGGGGGGGWHARRRDAFYVQHDCPLPAAFNASVRKPLHLKAAGAWAAVLMLHEAAEQKAAAAGAGAGAGPAVQGGEPRVAACAAVLLNVRLVPRPPTQPPPTEPRGAAGGAFAQHSSGSRCRDGADLLEGPLDGYTDCDEATRLCRLTQKCRARCERRGTCSHYTTWPSGFCQLSSRCADEVAASERGARTFRRRAAEEPSGSAGQS